MVLLKVIPVFQESNVVDEFEFIASASDLSEAIASNAIILANTRAQVFKVLQRLEKQLPASWPQTDDKSVEQPMEDAQQLFGVSTWKAIVGVCGEMRPVPIRFDMVDQVVKRISTYIQTLQPSGGDSLVSDGSEFSKDTSRLWFCGRILDSSEPLSKRFGTNDKTKVSVKLWNSAIEGPPKSVSDLAKLGDGARLIEYCLKVYAKQQAERCEVIDSKNSTPKPTNTKRSRKEDEELSMWQVPTKNLKLLSSNDEIVKQVSDPKLQLLLKQVDEAPNRHEMLEQLLLTNTEFAMFYDRVLLAVGAASVDEERVVSQADSAIEPIQ